MESPFFVRELFSNRNERVVKLVIGNNNPNDYIISDLFNKSDGWDIISVDPAYNVRTDEVSFVLTYRDNKDPDIFDLMFNVDALGDDNYILEVHCNVEKVRIWIREDRKKGIST